MPEKLKNGTLDFNTTSLENNSHTVLTAWVSKDKYLLKRLDINSSLTVTPKILNISSPDFKIVSTLNESTVYDNFGSHLNIVLSQRGSRPIFSHQRHGLEMGSLRIDKTLNGDKENDR